ncbi:hypothetical protein [Enterobacillus tribolii]|nr:hypothetical protein [Enterobacillus tribolii]
MQDKTGINSEWLGRECSAFYAKEEKRGRIAAPSLTDVAEDYIA